MSGIAYPNRNQKQTNRNDTPIKKWEYNKITRNRRAQHMYCFDSKFRFFLLD